MNTRDSSQSVVEFAYGTLINLINNVNQELKFSIGNQILVFLK